MYKMYIIYTHATLDFRYHDNTTYKFEGYTHIHTYYKHTRNLSLSLSLSLDVCVYLCIYVLYTVYMYVSMDVWMHVCMSLHVAAYCVLVNISILNENIRYENIPVQFVTHHCS